MTEDETKAMAVAEAKRVLEVHTRALAVALNEAAQKYTKRLVGLSQAAKNDIVYGAAQFYVFSMEEAMKRQEGDK